MRRPVFAILIGVIVPALCSAAGATWTIVSVPDETGVTGKSDPITGIQRATRAIALKDAGVTIATDLKTAIPAAPEISLFCISGRSIKGLKQLGLSPVALVERGGLTGARLVLIAREGVALDTLKGKRLASRPLSADLRSMLELEVFTPTGLELSGLIHVEVKKGIDAVLAVKTGQVELGLVDQMELDQTARVVPPVAAGIKRLQTSPELPFAALLVRNAQINDPDITRLTATLISGEVGQGTTDRWVPVKPE